MEDQNTLTSRRPSENGRSSSTPPENHDESPTHPHPGTVIPNRLFVGGIDFRVGESDLRRVFSQHGAVKEVKIVSDRSGMSKGYAFVTFENQDDALKILHDANEICVKDKKLSIGQAVRKQQTNSAHATIPDSARPTSCGMLHLTTPAGYPYVYHNGVAYFHCPNVSRPAHHWPPAPPPPPPVMLPQPFYQQPAYHHHHHQYPWNAVQPPVPSSPVMYSQQSEYPYQSADGRPVQPSLPVMEDTTPEVYPVYPQRTEGMTPFVLQHNPGKSRMFPHSGIHQKPRHRRYIHHKDNHYLPEATEPLDAGMLHTRLSPLM